MDRIDVRASLGLAAEANSLGYRVACIERDHFAGGRWFEAAASANPTAHVADRVGTTVAGGKAFQIDAGDSAWGSWVQILGSSDTPVTAGRAYFSPHQFIVENTERAATYFIQIARGSSGDAGYSAGTYTEFVYSATVQKETGIVIMQTGRAPVNSLLWARCICPGQATATLDFYFGIHEFEG